MSREGPPAQLRRGSRWGPDAPGPAKTLKRRILVGSSVEIELVALDVLHHEANISDWYAVHPWVMIAAPADIY